MAFGCVVILIVLLNLNSQGNFQTVIPQIAFFALAGYKLIPSFQQIYMNITNIKSNISALDSIDYDLHKSIENKVTHEAKKENFNNFKNIIFKRYRFLI